MLKRHIPLATVVVGLLAFTAVGAIAGGDSTNSPSMGVAQVDAIEPDAKRAMAVLERARDGADALPPELAARMDAQADFGMNPSLSRLAIGNTTNSLYAIPARDHVCAGLTVGEGASVICPSTDDVASGKSAPATVLLTTGDIGIYGIVPDGVDSVSVRGADGSGAREINVESNAYYTVVPAGTSVWTVGYEGPSGRTEFAIHDPSALDRTRTTDQGGH